MNIAQRIAKNVIALILSNSLFAASIFIFNIFIARYLGVNEFGKYSFAITFTTFLAVLSHLGLEAIVTRDVVLDKSRANKYFGAALGLQVCGSALMFLFIVLAINLWPNGSETRTITYILAAGTVAMTFGNLCRSIYRAFERMEWDILVVIIGAAFLLGIGLFALRSGYSLNVIGGVYSISQLLVFLVSLLVLLFRFTGITINADLKLWRYLLVTTIPFALNAFFVQIFFRVEITILAFLTNEAEVGWYTAAHNLVVLTFAVIVTAFGRAMFPSFAHSFVFNRELYKALIEKALRYSLIVLIPVGVGVTLVANNIVAIVYGSQFVNSIGVLRILIWVGILLFLNIFFISILEATGRQKKATLVLGVGSGINIILSFALIPRFNLVGAAVANLITQLVCLVMSCALVGQIVTIRILVKSVVKPAIACTLIVVVVFILAHLPFLPSVFLSIFAYLIILGLIRGIVKDDIETLRHLINRRKS